MDYEKRITEILFILAILLSAFIFGPDLMSLYNRLAFNPCKSPVEYSIGNIDGSFAVSNDYLLSAVEEAEGLWEGASQKNLFEYSLDKGIKINLVYDYRQDSTVQLNNLGGILETDNSYYLNLKREYDGYVVQYNSDKARLDSLASSYGQQLSSYQKEIDSWNKNRGSQEKYNQLVLEKQNLDAMLSRIKTMEEQNNALVAKINGLARDINTLAGKVNLNVNNYNDISQSVEKEFEQGNYKADSITKEINIYQFENKEKLVMVLTHELGHALGIGHMDNPEDIMSSINAGESQKITSEDLTELDKICSKNLFFR